LVRLTLGIWFFAVGVETNGGVRSSGVLYCTGFAKGKGRVGIKGIDVLGIQVLRKQDDYYYIDETTDGGKQALKGPSLGIILVPSRLVVAALQCYFISFPPPTIHS
jgi:hypothetical protein